MIYTYTGPDGKRQQKWETAATKKEANKKKAFIEYYQIEHGRVLVPLKTSSEKEPGTLTEENSSLTVREFMPVFIELYGKLKWSFNTYYLNCHFIEHYIVPYIGDWDLNKITALDLTQYYSRMLREPERLRIGQKGPPRCIQPAGVHKIHAVLCCALNQAIRWGYRKPDKGNPAMMAVLPEMQTNARKVWNIDTFIQALDLAEGTLLGLCMHLAFSCSLRVGEILGLTWDDVIIDEKACLSDNARIKVEKEMSRIPCRCLEAIGEKEVYRVFPTSKKDASTRLVLKSPKTKSSNRIVWLPETVAELLIAHRKSQNERKAFLGSDYFDYDLVIAHEDGRPVESRFILKKLHDLCDAHNLEAVDFHSLRHLSTSYKLKLTNGDVKSVQGDTGHSQASMVVEVYSRILDEDRKNNAKKLEEQFYKKKESSKESDDSPLQDLLESLTTEQQEELLKKLWAMAISK